MLKELFFITDKNGIKVVITIRSKKLRLQRKF